MKAFVFFLSQLVFVLASADLLSQSLPSARETIVYKLIKTDDSLMLSFISSQDTIHFKREVKKSDEPAPMLGITVGHSHSYSVIAYFSGRAYIISALPDDSLVAVYGDMPYGELIVDGLAKIDRVNNSLNVNRLNCTVSINGVRGVPTLDLGGKTVDTEKLKKLPIKEILVTNNKGDKVFCSAKKEVSNSTGTAIYSLWFNEMNSQRLNEHLKVSVLFIFWLYKKAA